MKPIAAGPITEQLIHVLLIQEEAFTVRCFGTTCASKAVFAGSAKPRAMPLMKIIAYNPDNELVCARHEIMARAKVHAQEIARVTRMILRLLAWSATYPPKGAIEIAGIASMSPSHPRESALWVSLYIWKPITTASARLARVKRPTEPIKRRISGIFRASLKSWCLL